MGMGEFGEVKCDGSELGVGVRGGWWLICWITNTLSAENDGLKVGNIPALKDGI